MIILGSPRMWKGENEENENEEDKEDEEAGRGRFSSLEWRVIVRDLTRITCRRPRLQEKIKKIIPAVTDYQD